MSDKYPGWHSLINNAKRRICENDSNSIGFDRLTAVFQLMEKCGRCDFVFGVKVEEAKEEVEQKNT